jgi:hypothetical protein
LPNCLPLAACESWPRLGSLAARRCALVFRECGLNAQHTGRPLADYATSYTVRTVGGALGVAVLGSILSSRYSSDMASAVQGLPAPAAHAARDSVGAALHVAAQSGNPALAGAAKNAFVGGMTGAIWLAAAIVALIALPAREGAEVPMAADGDAFEATAA